MPGVVPRSVGRIHQSRDARLVTYLTCMPPVTCLTCLPAAFHPLGGKPAGVVPDPGAARKRHGIDRRIPGIPA